MYAQHRGDGPSLQGAQMIDIWSISSLLTCSKGQEHFFFLPDLIEKTLKHVLICNTD